MWNWIIDIPYVFIPLNERQKVYVKVYRVCKKKRQMIKIWLNFIVDIDPCKGVIILI